MKLEDSWQRNPVERLLSGDVVDATGSSCEVGWLDDATRARLRHVTTAESGRATPLLDGPLVFVTRAGSVDCFSLDGHRAIALGLPDNVQHENQGSP